MVWYAVHGFLSALFSLYVFSIRSHFSSRTKRSQGLSLRYGPPPPFESRWHGNREGLCPSRFTHLWFGRSTEPGGSATSRLSHALLGGPFHREGKLSFATSGVRGAGFAGLVFTVGETGRAPARWLGGLVP